MINKIVSPHSPPLDMYGYRFTNAIVSERAGIPLSKVRRYAKDFLTADNEATRQSGKTRYLNAEEVFIIMLAEYLINELRFTTDEGKAILTDIRPWLRKNSMIPGTTPEPDDDLGYDDIDEDGKEFYVEAPIYYSTIIYIMRANTDSGFYYRTRKEIDKTHKNIGGQRITTEEYVEGAIVSAPKGKFLLDDRTMYLLPVNLLKYDFGIKLLGFAKPSQILG